MKLLRRLALVAALAAGLCLVMPGVHAATESPDPNATGFAQLQACVQGSKRVEALYVMDESGSLNNTDPSNERFGALEASVAQLGALASSGSSAPTVEAAIASFGDSYTPPSQVMPWTEIPANGADEVASKFRSAAESEWNDDVSAKLGTNYAAALSGGAQSLLERGSSRGTCRVLIWFTDGLFDIGTPEDTDSAAAQMCAPGGPVDQLRDGQISLVALALFNDAVAAELDKPEKQQRRGELEAIAIGESGARACGSVPISSDQRSGVYLPVNSAAQLGLLFSGAIAQSGGGTPVSVDATRPVTVPIEPGVRSFQVDAAVSSPPESVSVTSPDGSTAQVSLAGTPTDVSGGRAVAHVYESMVSLTVTMPGSGTPGTWKIDAGDVSSAAVYLFSGLTLNPDTSSPQRLVAGRQETITLVATDPAGAPADLSVYANVEAVAKASTLAGEAPATITVTEPASGRVEVTVDVPDEATGVHLVGNITPSLPSGTVLAPVPFDFPLPVTLPAAFPTIDPASELALGTQVGVTELGGTVTALGSMEGPTSVCFDPPQNQQVPERAKGVTVTPPPDCVPLQVGERKRVPITVTSEQSADGRASAELPVRLNVLDAAGKPLKTAELSLPVTWTMVRPVDQGRRLLLVAGLVLLAIALPLLALWASNRALARFTKGNLRYSRNTVHLGPDGPQRPESERLFDPTELAWEYITPAQRRRYGGAGGGLMELRAISPLNPFGGPSFRAVAATGQRIVGADAGMVVHGGHWTPVTQGLGAIYLLMISEANLHAATDETAHIDATLILLTRSDSVDDLDQLVRRANHRFDWPTVLSTLRDLADHDHPQTKGDEPSVPRPSHSESGQPTPYDDPWAEPAGASPVPGTGPVTRPPTAGPADPYADPDA